MASQTLKRTRNQAGTAASPDKTSDKPTDKSAKLDVCQICNESVSEDCIECYWCSRWEHRACAKLKETELVVLSSGSKNILYFCSCCLSVLPDALSSFKPNVLALEETCKKLQQSVENLSSQIATLSASNKNLQTEIENTSESLNSIPTNSATVPSPSSAMSIIDELADRDRRKKNIIVYNLPEPASNDKSDSAQNNQSDSDAFSALCSSVYNSSFTITKLLRLGKKQPNKIRPLLICFEHEEDRVTVLSHSHQLCKKDAYKNVFISPDRTKFEREKHKNLVSGLKNRRLNGEKDLVIRNGAIVTKSAARSNTPANSTTVPMASNQHS